MKKIIALLFTGIILAGCHDTENTFYESGELECKLQYKKDTKIMDGVQKCFYKSGKKWKEEIYKDGEEDGVWNEWYENGQLKKRKDIGSLKEADENEKDFVGVYEEGWYKSGTLKTESRFNKDGSIGTKEWYESGQLAEEASRLFLSGKRNGFFREWYENGKMKSEEHYKDDNVVDRKEWYENGKLKHIMSDCTGDIILTCADEKFF